MALDLGDLRFSRMSEDQLRKKDALLAEGDLLFTRYNGNPGLVGSCALVAGNKSLTYPDKLIRVRVSREVSLPIYVAFAFSSSHVRNQIKLSLRSTAGQVGISGSDLKKIRFPLPPLAEQRRIVSALEADLSRLDSAQVLLEKSLARVIRLEKRLVDADLDPLFLGEVKPLGELLSEPLRNGHSARAVSQGGVRTLTLTAVTKGVFSDSHTKMTSASLEKSKGLWLETGDIFIQRSNTPDLVGTSAIYQGPSEWAIFPDLLVRVRVSESLDPLFVLKILQSTRVRSHFKRFAKGLAGSMPKIDQRTIEQVSVPVPSLAVQHEIVDRIKERAQSMSRVSEELQGARKRAGYLRKALLDAAFTGKLVPQDPADEPAAVLLERIRSERASAPNPKRARQSTAKPPKRLASTADVRTPADPQPVHAGEQTALEF